MLLRDTKNFDYISWLHGVINLIYIIHKIRYIKSEWNRYVNKCGLDLVYPNKYESLCSIDIWIGRQSLLRGVTDKCSKGGVHELWLIPSTFDYSA